MTWGAVAGIGGAVVGGLIAADSNRSASNKMADASAASDATQKQMYDQTRQDNLPAMDARNASLDKMRQLLGIGGDPSSAGYGSLGGSINPGDVQNEAGYQFGLTQGQTALNNQLGARGMRNSGAALKAASRFGNDYATTKYDNAFNRAVANRSAQLNPLQSVAGLGQTGAFTVAGAGQNYANQVGANQIGLGNALGASTIAQGNVWGNALNQGAGWYANQQNQQQRQQDAAWNKYVSGRGTYGGGSSGPTYLDAGYNDLGY